MSPGMVGVGVTTINRPELFYECLESVELHLSGVVDMKLAIRDGGLPYPHRPPPEWLWYDSPLNLTMPAAKNVLLEAMCYAGVEHLFLLEDDTLIRSPRAVTEYLWAARESGLSYLSAHPASDPRCTLTEAGPVVSLWNHVGTMWTYMHRSGYERAGGFDEGFGNYLSNIELPQRWARLGLTSGWGRIPDANGSEAWVTVRCVTKEESAIAGLGGWDEGHERSLAYWMGKHPETCPSGVRPATEGRPSRKCLPATP